MPNAKHPARRTPTEFELSRRAKAILARRDSAESGDVQLDDLSIMCTQGDLIIERTTDYRMIYVETPNGTVVRTSLQSELSWAVEVIKRHSILDDLADV